MKKEDYEIMELMNNIEYGWIDKDHNKHNHLDDSYSKTYMLQSPSELIRNKLGVCWDQVELERYYFSNIDTKTYFIVYYDKDKCPTHTFLTYIKDNKHYWFEHSWERFRGINEYNSEEELLLDVKNKFIKYELKNDIDEDFLVIYQYSKPDNNISTEQFYKHCEAGIKIKV